MVGQPMQAQVVGQQYMGPQMGAEDSRQSQAFWTMYIIGWLACCFCGIGPCVWAIPLVMWVAIPSDRKPHMPQTKTAYTLNLITCGGFCLLGVLVFLMIVASIIVGGSATHNEEHAAGSATHNEEHTAGQVAFINPDSVKYSRSCRTPMARGAIITP